MSAYKISLQICFLHFLFFPLPTSFVLCHGFGLILGQMDKQTLFGNMVFKSLRVYSCILRIKETYVGPVCKHCLVLENNKKKSLAATFDYIFLTLSYTYFKKLVIN